jgi:hypothetical protein
VGHTKVPRRLQPVAISEGGGGAKTLAPRTHHTSRTSAQQRAEAGETVGTEQGEGGCADRETTEQVQAASATPEQAASASLNCRLARIAEEATGSGGFSGDRGGSQHHAAGRAHSRTTVAPLKSDVSHPRSHQEHLDDDSLHQHQHQHHHHQQECKALQRIAEHLQHLQDQRDSKIFDEAPQKVTEAEALLSSIKDQDLDGLQATSMADKVRTTCAEFEESRKHHMALVQAVIQHSDVDESQEAQDSLDQKLASALQCKHQCAAAMRDAIASFSLLLARQP